MMDCGWESSDDDQQMEIDLESRQERQEEQKENTITTEDVSPVSQSGEGCDPSEPAEDYDPADPTSDVEDSHDNPSQENENVSSRSMEASDYDPADPTVSDNEGSHVKKEDSDENGENSGQTEGEVKEDDIQKTDSSRESDVCLEGDGSVDIGSQEEDNDGRWDSQLEASFSHEQLEEEEEEEAELGMSPNKAEEEAEILTSPSKDEEGIEIITSPSKDEEEAEIITSPYKDEEVVEEEEEAGTSPGKAEEEEEAVMSPGKAEEEEEAGMSLGKAEEEVGMSPSKAEGEQVRMSPNKAEEEEAGRFPNEAVEEIETEVSDSKIEETNARMSPSKMEKETDVATSLSKAEEAEDKSEFSSIAPENSQEIVTFEDHQTSRDETFGRSHMPTTPPLDTDDNTQASNISLINNADDGTSDVPEVTFNDSDFVLEKEPFEPSIEEKEVQNYQGQTQESSGWRSVDSQGEEETSWRKTHGNHINEGESDTFRRGEEVANRDEEALVDLFREESEPDKDNVVDGEAEQPVKKTKKKLGSKKVKKKGKKLKKGQGKKGLTKLHDSTHGDQRFVEISKERPSIDSKEDGELDTEALGHSRKRSHEERLSLGVYDQVMDIEFAHLEEDEQREPGEIVESEGKKKGSKKKEKKERKKKKTRREVATIEDGGQGDDDSQKFPSFLAGFFVQDEGEGDLDESHDNFVNVFDEDEARGFHKSSTEKNYRKRQDSGQEDSVRSFDHNVIENQDRRVEEVEHRRSRKHEERRHESRERQHSSRDIREVRYEREHRHELPREKERDREKERSRNERTRERVRDKERERERERDRERERERLRRSEGEERRRRGSRSRSMERHRRSRSYERNRRSRSRDRSSRQRRRRSRSYDRSLERDRERERERERERSKRRRKERSREREIQRRVRRASHSRSRSPRRRAERASSNKENRDESHRRRRQRYQEESESEERENSRRLQRRQRHERERSSSSSSSSSQSSSSHHISFQNTLLNHSFQSRHSSEDEGASSDVILVEPERIVINLDEEEDPPSRVDITHANARDDSATLVDGQSIPPPPEMSGSARASALIEINPAEHEDNAEEETGDATPTRDEATDIARSKNKTPPAVPESDYDPAHPTEEDGDQELVTNAIKDTTRPPVEKGPVPPDHPPPEEVRPSPPPVPAESVLEPPQPRPPMPNPVMRLINPLLLQQQQQQSNHQQQPGLLPFPNMPGQPPGFMNWPVNQNNSGQPPSAFGQGQRHMRPLLPTPDGRGPGFRPDSSGARPPFSTNSLPPMNLQQTGPGPHPQMPISSMPPLAQLTSLLPALEKAKLAAQDSSQPLMFKPGGSGNSLLGKPPLSASLSSNMSSMRMSSYRGRPDLSESTEVVDMDMSPGDEDCELELPSPNSDSSGSREGRRRRGRRGDSHHSKYDKSAPSSSNKGIIQPVVYLKALSKAIEKLTPRGSAPGGTASSHDRAKQASSRKRRVDLNDDDVPASAVDLTNKEKYMRKLHLQERVIDEVKLAIKPFYSSKKINKDQYKLILRKAVPKVCHSKSGNINPQKIQQLVEAYVGKLIKGKTTPKKKRAHPPTKDGAGKDNKDAAAPVRQNGERPKKVSR